MYYPDQARYARLAAEQLGAEFIDLDGGNGFVFRITKNNRSLTGGAGRICSYPINNSSSFGISRDKAHTNAILKSCGIPCIHGNHFFVSASHSTFRNPGHEFEDALAFARQRGFPVFCKPIAGSHGDFAEVVLSELDLRTYAERLHKRYDAFLIEPVLNGDEYRVLIHDQRPLYYAMKKRPEITGDGNQSLRELLETINEALLGRGVSAFPISAILASGHRPDYIPAKGEAVPLVGRQNLSATGGINILDTIVPKPLADLGAAACHAIGLRLGAVDIFDTSPHRDLSELVVIEINGNPALSALENSGRIDLILELWKSMIREFVGD